MTDWLAHAGGHVDILWHLLAALAAGGVIGLERSFHGRPAGFRTHALVCMASSSLMLVTVYQEQWFPDAAAATVRIDPTRMAQGVMTGIGFLGAGVIMKEGLSVRGLTTAASIWMTSTIGILAGVGFYVPVVLTTTLTLGTLSFFRWIEARMPTQIYARHRLRFARDRILPEAEVRELIDGLGCSIANLSYEYSRDGRFFEYRMMLRTRHADDLRRLANALTGNDAVLEFHIAPTGD